MKRIWLVVCLLALVAVPSYAGSLSGGVAFMDSSDAGDDTGIGVRVSVDVGAKWNFDFRAAFFDSYSIVQSPRTIDIEANVVDLGISYDFTTAGKVTPYVGAGLNYNNYDADAINNVRNEREEARIKDEVGAYGVAGIEIPLRGRIALWAEVLYRLNEPSIQGDGLAAFSAIDVDFSGVGANAGLAFTW